MVPKSLTGRLNKWIGVYQSWAARLVGLLRDAGNEGRGRSEGSPGGRGLLLDEEGKGNEESRKIL